MDIIYINDLRIETFIGIYGWERKTKQTVVLDIEMGTVNTMLEARNSTFTSK